MKVHLILSLSLVCFFSAQSQAQQLANGSYIMKSLCGEDGKYIDAPSAYQQYKLCTDKTMLFLTIYGQATNTDDTEEVRFSLRREQKPLNIKDIKEDNIFDVHVFDVQKKSFKLKWYNDLPNYGLFPYKTWVTEIWERTKLKNAAKNIVSLLAADNTAKVLDYSSEPLIVIDGKIKDVDLSTFDLTTADKTSFANLLGVSPDEIADIKVLKNESATNKYGGIAGEGVIELKTKHGTAAVKDKRSMKEKMYGMWKKVGTRMPNGKVFVGNHDEYKIYGRDYSLLISSPMSLSAVNDYSVNGVIRKTEYINEAMTTENGGSCAIKWLSQNYYMLTYIDERFNQSVDEFWVRVSLPEDISLLFRGIK